MDVFFIEDDELLEIYNGIWNKVSNSIKKELDCEPIYNKTFVKTRIKSYDHEATDFHYNEIPKVCSNYTCLAVISLDSVLKKDQDYYLQVFLKKCECINKRKKVIRHITDHLENSSGESDE